jgi:hypothetical protein
VNELVQAYTSAHSSAFSLSVHSRSNNYINLNIGLTLTIYQSIAYFIQWVIVGAAIGLIYKPSKTLSAKAELSKDKLLGSCRRRASFECLVLG